MDRETECRRSTIRSHRSRLRHFTRWCEQQAITNCNDLTGRLLHEYRIWRRNEGDLAPPTERGQMNTLRVFVRWLGTIDGCDPDLHLKVRSPKIRPGEHARTEMLDSEHAEPMLAYLEKYEYATPQHVVLSLLWHTMLRVGAARALELGDYDREESFLAVVDRADTGTPIKNGKGGQRLIALDDRICTLLNDYIRDRRREITDDHGRKPLLTTSHGRMSRTTIRRYCYEYSRPCEIGLDCPHGMDPETCEYRPIDEASKCPSSVSPHPFRRGAITHYLANDVPETAVSQRANVSPDVLEQHYDQRTAKEKMEQRRGYLSNI